MRHRMKSIGVAAGMSCLWLSASRAQDRVVQNFGDWTVIIQPGPSSGPAPSPDLSTTNEPKPESVVITASQREVPPTPEGVSPPGPMPAANDLPIITPGESGQCCDPKPVVEPPEGTPDPRYMPRLYSDLYRGIPFVRAEYDANPSYIHDTAVEFLFGKMRPTVIHRGRVNVNVSSPYSYGYPAFGYGSPYNYGGYGFGGYPYGLAYPPIQLVVPGTGLRIHRLN